MKFGRNAKSRSKRAYKSSSKTKVQVKVPARVRPKTAAVIERIATTAAKRVMNRSEETKVAYVKNSLIKFNSAIDNTGDILNVIPSPISRGTGPNQRIGNKITPTRLIIEGHCFAAPDNGLGSLIDAVVPPIEVTMYLLRPKNLRTFTELTVADTNFLQTPTGQTNYDGTLGSAILPVDKTNYELIGKRRFVLAAPASSFANTGAAVTNAGMVGTNGCSIAKRFKFSFRPKGSWEYNESDSTGNHPANQCYFMCCGYTYLQNYTPDTTSVKFQMQYNTTLYYKDS